MNDLISVIIPIYNVEEYIDKCIESVIKQTYTNLEIILVDDGSTDSSGNKCDEYEKKDVRVRVIHKQNGGVSQARNDGMKVSNGNMIAFVDADDWIDENYFKKMVEVMKNEDADVVLCGYYRVTSKKYEKIFNEGFIKKYNGREFLINSLSPQTGFGFTHMKLYRREIIGSIQFEKNMVVSEDALFNIQISNNVKKASFLHQCLYYYRINEKSVVRRYDDKYMEKYINAMFYVKKCIESRFQIDSEILKKYYNFVAYHVLLIVVNYCCNKNNNDKNSLKKIYENKELNEAIKKCDYNEISTTRKITLFSVKHKLFFIIKCICSIRRWQNKE